jgi:hypothetical protein
MSQFFFHCKDALGHTVDADGHKCPGIEDAEEQAAVTAAALLKGTASLSTTLRLSSAELEFVRNSAGSLT